MGKQWKQWETFIFFGSKISADGDCSHEIKMLAPWKKSYDQPRQHIKKQRHYFANKGPSSQTYAFSSSHVWTWELDYKESWMPKNLCFWTVVLEKTLESPLDCKEIQPVNPAEAKATVLWPPDGRTDSLEKTLMLGNIEGSRRRGHRGWDGWMASPTQLRELVMDCSVHGALQPMWSQSIECDWGTKVKWKRNREIITGKEINKEIIQENFSERNALCL